MLCSSQIVFSCTYQSSDRLHIRSPCHSLVRTPDDSSNVLTLGSRRVAEKTCDTERIPYPSVMVAEHGCGPRECISERTDDEQIVDESLEAARADLADTEKGSASQDRNLLGTVEQIPDVLAQEMVEQLVKLPKTVSQNRTQQQTEEQVMNAPVPQVMERRTDRRTPAISLAGKIDEVPVSDTQEKTQQVENTHAQHVVNTVNPSPRRRSTR